MLTTDQKGAAAEAAIAATAVKLGVDVYLPMFDSGARYDLIFELDGRLLRVQCKWARRVGDVVLVRCYSCRRASEGMRVRRYTRDEVDLIAAYCPDVDSCFALEPELFVGRRVVHLRLAPSRNQQRAGINWAAEYELGAKLEALLGP
ncbi:MAG TPA: group I intron-associated PD-(D/E)XK endonuclease [Gaiellaceae bacterium]